MQTVQVGPDLIEGGSNALLSTVLLPVKILLNGMSDQCSGRGEAPPLYCLLNLSMGLVWKADGGLRHRALSLSKARREPFSDILQRKIFGDSQAGFTGAKTHPRLSARQAVRKRRKGARTNPIYVPLRVKGAFLSPFRGLRMFHFVLILFSICLKMFYPNKTHQLAFERFRSLKSDTPRSKMAVLRGLYPEISATLQLGHSLKDIHEKLVEDGFEVSYAVLLTYVNRIRREKARPPFVASKRPPAFPVSRERTAAEVEIDDPLANAMRALSKPRYDIRQAMCDGDPTKKKLI